MKKNFILLLLLLGIFFLVFRQWILSNEIIGGDWPYFFNETLREFSLFPPAWSLLHGNGLGGIIPAYYLDQYLYFTAYLSTSILHIPWAVGYKLFWFGLFIALSIFSSIYLLKTIFPHVKLWQMTLAALIFTTNTYILMVVGGGQMGVALAYSMAPLVLVRFLMIVQSSKFKVQSSLVAGLILAAQVMFDPRIAYITMTAVVLYQILNRVNIVHALLVPVGIAVLLHSYWIFPLLVTRTLPIPEGFLSVSGFKFFSFADFSHAISLLHPNWPENIFGKIYFLQPEFLILPIIAYSSLLFISKIKNQKFNNNLTIEQFNNRTIIFFSFLGLLGAFLAKGANPPFGELNQWLFQYIPGMNMFRDPTKFYVMTTLSYSILIPFSLYSAQEWLISKIKNQKSKIQSKYQIFNFSYVFLIFTISYLIFLIRPAVFGQLGGTLKHHDVPKEYIKLKDFLHSQPDFFRTLWIPRQQRFTFVSNTHPAIEAMPLFEATNSARIVSGLQESESQRLLEELSVKYVVVPYDSLGEIFLKDRKYDERQYEDTIREIKKVAWPKKLEGFGRIAIFEIPNPKDHFWLNGQGKVSYKMISPTQYSLSISTPGPSNFIFSENYSPYWMVKTGDKEIKSIKSNNNLNSFILDGAHNFNVEVYYSQEKYYKYGRILSVLTLLVITLLFLVEKSKKR